MITIRLPWPYRQLFQNDRSDRFVKAKWTRAARHAAWAETYKALDGEPFAHDGGRIPVRLTYHPPNRRYDQGNVEAACKAYIDGIADALRVNDRLFDLEHVHGDVVRGGEVVVEIGKELET